MFQVGLCEIRRVYTLFKRGFYAVGRAVNKLLDTASKIGTETKTTEPKTTQTTKTPQVELPKPAPASEIYQSKRPEKNKSKLL